MDHKPRPLSQPVLSRSQWVRATFMGLLMAIGTLYLEAASEGTSAALAASMGFLVFSLLNIVLGLSARSETATVFERDTFGDSRQLRLYGLALLMVLLPLEIGFLQRVLGLEELGIGDWLPCLAIAVAYILVDEVVKLFLRRRRGAAPAGSPATV
jgi:Ca2+-transporting ATPase